MLERSATTFPFRRQGAVTAWLVVCLGVIVAIVALGMDGGRMMEERRAAQTAADAAALAAANNLYANYLQNQGTDPNDTAADAALAAARANGYANDGTNSVVTVNIPPQSGAFVGKKNRVEVIIQSNLAGSFSAIFTRSPLRVEARAVARGRPMNIGLLLLQPFGIALTITGSGNVQVVNAPIVVNSTSPLAYTLTGTGSVSALYHDVGGILAALASIAGPINTNVSPTPDPLRSLAAPNPGSYGVQAKSPTTIGSGTVTLQPGIYDGGININGSASVTLAPGVYVLNGGGLTVSSGASLTGNGVVLYNTGGSSGGSINISGGIMNLTPPTSGPYQGISVFQDRSLSNAVQISGNGSTQITGTVYAPAAAIQLSGNGTSNADVLGGAYIASSLVVSGSASFSINQGSNRPRVPETGLVE
jgi:hypothetical protein